MSTAIAPGHTVALTACPAYEDKGHHFVPTGREQDWSESFTGTITAIEVRSLIERIEERA